jgi:hypothetical protein
VVDAPTPPAPAPAPEPAPAAAPPAGAGIGETLTSAAGFRATVIEAPQPALVVFRGITDQFVEGDRSTTFNLPADAFAHTKADAVVSVEAKLSDGQALPTWVQFDAQAGTFTVAPPAGYTGTLEIQITARDNEGRAADAVFKFNIGEGVQPPQEPAAQPPQPTPAPAPDAPRPQSRSGLSEQIRLAQGRNALSASAWRAAFLRGEVGLLPEGLQTDRAADETATSARPQGLLERILASRGVQQRLAQAAQAGPGALGRDGNDASALEVGSAPGLPTATDPSPRLRAAPTPSRTGAG